jgi:vesicular inhibitory amino acid transporter
VFPNIYRDMRHSYKYAKAVNYTYINTFALEAAIGIAGYLMFGDDVKDELTASIFTTKGYPQSLSILMVIAVAIIPLTKIPLK